jgi:SAM-dependent methyltransferase
MQDALYYQLSDIDQTHWWHVGRRNLVKSCLDSLHFPHVNSSLDIGCGTGSNLGLLKQYSAKVTGLDSSTIALNLAKDRYIEEQFIKADANCLQNYFKPDSFGLITMFNVLYHKWIIDDATVVKQIFNLLTPEGFFVITEPAHKFLMRRHDDLDMGKTRYSLKEIEEKLKAAGFIIDKATYFNMISFFPALILKWLESILPKPKSSAHDERVKEIELPPAWLNRFMLFVLNAETIFIKRFGRLPTGLGVLLIAHKPR